MTRQTERGEDASGERKSIESRRESRFCPKAIPDVVKKERKRSSCSSSSTRRVIRRARTRADVDDATVVRDANGSGNPRRASSNDASLPPSASASAAASSAVAPAAPTSAAEPLPAPAPASVSAPAPASPPARRPLLLLLEVLLLDEADHLIRDADVLDGVPAHVAVGHAPEPVAVLARADHLLQVHVHPRVAAHKVAVVRLAVLKLHQLRERDARGTNEAKKMDDERRGVSATRAKKKSEPSDLRRRGAVDSRAIARVSRGARAVSGHRGGARRAGGASRDKTSARRTMGWPWDVFSSERGSISRGGGFGLRHAADHACGGRICLRPLGSHGAKSGGSVRDRAARVFEDDRGRRVCVTESPSAVACGDAARPRAFAPSISNFREGQKTPARSISRPLGFSLCARQQRQSGSRGVRPRLGA